MNTAAISTMQNAVKNYLRKVAESKTSNNNGGVVQGKIQGSNILVGNKSYPYEPAVDVYYKDGDSVWCLLTTGNNAVIVGN